MLSFTAAHFKPDVEVTTGHQRTAALIQGLSFSRKVDNFPVYQKGNFLQRPANCKNVAVNENKNEQQMFLIKL